MANKAELLDGSLDPSQLAGNLDDLARFNRHGFLWPSLQHWPPRSGPIRLLDVGTGGADIPRILLRRAAKEGVRLEVIATDIRPEIVTEARRRSEGRCRVWACGNGRSVRHGLRQREPSSMHPPRKCLDSLIARRISELLLDPKQLVVFRSSLASRGCAGLHLTRVGRNCDV